MRCLQKTDRTFTADHQAMLDDLYTLSVSRYSEVGTLSFMVKPGTVLYVHTHIVRHCELMTWYKFAIITLMENNVPSAVLGFFFSS